MQPGFSTEQQELLSESSFLPFRQLSVSSRPARNAVKHTQKHLRERLNQVQKRVRAANMSWGFICVSLSWGEDSVWGAEWDVTQLVSVRLKSFLPKIKLYWNLYLILSKISVLSAIISTYWWWFTSSKQHSNCVPLDRIVSCAVSFIVKTLWCPLLVWLHWKTDTRVAPLLQHQDECWSCTLLQTADMEQLYVYQFSVSCCENTAV